MSNDLGSGPSQKTGTEHGLKKIWNKLVHRDDGSELEKEVMSMLEAGQESGMLKEEGKKMINSIFAFDDKLAYEIMTPRTDVFVIDIEDPPEEYLNDLMTLRYSRIPVCRGETDNIIGVLHIKDYLIKVPVGTSVDLLSYVSEIKDDSDDVYTLWRKVQITGEVNSAVPGTYKCTYYVIDSQNNISNNAVLTVIVE